MGAWYRTAVLGLAASLTLAGCATAPTDNVGAATAAPARASPDAPPSPQGNELALAAMNFLDRPYQMGGQSLETGFDCSGFTRYLFGHTLGIELPRSVQEQAQASVLRPVARDALQPGDLVFFNTQQRTFSHVGIYLGDGRFIHAPRTGAQIRAESLAASYWSRRYTGARRAVAAATP